MKFLLGSDCVSYWLAKFAGKKIREKFGVDVQIDILNLDVETADKITSADISVKLRCSNNDIAKLVEKVMK